MQKRSRKQKKNTWGFSHCCQGNHKISQSQAWSVSEVDVFRLYFAYICGYLCVFGLL